MSSKLAAAVALGRRGGQVNSPAQQAARRRNGQLGGAPRRYRLAGDTLERREGDHWLTLDPPYNRAARAFLRRQAGHPTVNARPQ